MVTAIQRHNRLLETAGIKNFRSTVAETPHFKKPVPKVGTSLPRKSMVTIYSLRKSGKLAELIRQFEKKD